MKCTREWSIILMILSNRRYAFQTISNKQTNKQKFHVICQLEYFGNLWPIKFRWNCVDDKVLWMANQINRIWFYVVILSLNDLTFKCHLLLRNLSKEHKLGIQLLAPFFLSFLISTDVTNSMRSFLTEIIFFWQSLFLLELQRNKKTCSQSSEVI